MKGFTDIHWSIFVWVAAIFVIVIMLFFFIFFKVTGKDPMMYSVEFVDISIKPYHVSSPLMHLRVGDRKIMEHVLEASVVGSFARTNSTGVPGNVSEFLDSYNFDYYDVRIEGDNTIPIVNSFASECGPAGDKRGVCIDISYGCGIGRMDITGEAESGDCDNEVARGFRCCVWDPDAYEDSTGEEIYRCGDYGMGVCNRYCDSRTMINLENGVEYCEDEVGWEYLRCCVPKRQEELLRTEFAGYAMIPLFYKGVINYIKVTIDDY